MALSFPSTESDVATLLRTHGISPTAQRILIARVIFSHGTHLSAEEVFSKVNASNQKVSKATVYNTLGLLASRGVVREVIADPKRVFYDPNTLPHYHFYDEATGRLTDIDATQVKVTGLPSLPENTELQGVDVIIRLRRQDS
ncbi:MAG: transcriptional repressor [Gammaproteobacteria bacterium]|nr:transcriptional repressor [Gammaproteobacteria bacterium]